MPTVAILLSITVLLEAAKLVYAVMKEYKKRKGQAQRVLPANVPNQNLRKLARQSGQNTKTLEIRKRSNSLPERSQGKKQRRLSLQHIIKRTECKDRIKFAKNTLKTCPPGVTLQGRGRQEKTFSTFLKELLLRTSTIVTVFALTGICITVVAAYISSSSLGIFAKIVMLRLNTYVLVVTLVVFDKDVLSYLFEMFHF